MIHCYEFYASPVYIPKFFPFLGTSKERGSTVSRHFIDLLQTHNILTLTESSGNLKKIMSTKKTPFIGINKPKGVEGKLKQIMVL